MPPQTVKPHHLDRVYSLIITQMNSKTSLTQDPPPGEGSPIRGSGDRGR